MFNYPPPLLTAQELVIHYLICVVIYYYRGITMHTPMGKYPPIGCPSFLFPSRLAAAAVHFLAATDGWRDVLIRYRRWLIDCLLN